MTTAPTPDEILSALRVDIDRIDAAMHALLIERGDIIEQLIAVKGRQGGGSAFRPGREAEMMRRLAERHRGPLPLDTVESIWRVIIATFTFVQAPYVVHADMSHGDAAMRDSVRFHFGFTVPLQVQRDARAVIDAVAAAEGDLGLVAADGTSASAPWWTSLAGERAPKIIARLPFVERSDHPASLPVFVIARPSAAAAVRDVVLLAVAGPGADAMAGLREADAKVIGSGSDDRGPLRLVAVPGARAAAVAEGLRDAYPLAHVSEVGSHAARYTFDADPPAASA